MTKRPVTAREKPKIFRVAPDQKDLLSQITIQEEEIFGRGGLNEWHLPFMCRHGLVLAAVSGGTVLAAAEFMRSWDEPESAYLVGLWVKDSARGGGLGRRLVDHALARLAEEGFASVTLTCSPDNQKAAGLYERAGFKSAGTLPGEYGPGNDRVLYEIVVGE